MAYQTSCPSCSHAFDVEGAGDQAKFQQRLKAKGDEAKALADKIRALEEGASTLDALRSERDALRSELEGVRSAAEIGAAFASAGVADDEAIRSSFQAIYQSQMADVAEDERTPYSEWIGSEAARGHVLLSSCYAPQGEQPPAEQPPAGQPPAGNAPRVPRSIPNTEAGTLTPSTAPAKPPTVEEVRAYFRSPAYRALPPEQRKAEQARLQSEMSVDS